MSKTKIILTSALLIGLIVLSYYMNRDSFAPETIQISHRVSPWLKSAKPGARRANDLGEPVTFTMNGFHRLTSVKVFVASEIATNRYAKRLWELTTDSNSIPTSSFVYGNMIKGMRAPAKGVRPDALVPGVTNRLFITTDKGLEAEHDFMVPLGN